MQLLDLRRGECVLLVGVGTGADLPLLPEDVSVIGIDLSPDRLARTRAMLPLPGRDEALIQAGAQSLPIGAGQFDEAVLSVVPDGADCLRETLWTLGSDGRAVIKALGWGLARTMTLAEGAEQCDFRFKKDGDTRVAMPEPLALYLKSRRA